MYVGCRSCRRHWGAHYDGSTWSTAKSGTNLDLTAVWGLSANEVWAVGSGIILRWNGSAWTQSNGGEGANLYAVWGTAANDIWAVGEYGAIGHWNGTAWSSFYGSIPDGGVADTLVGVWGSSTKDVWAVGQAANIMHWDGVSWSILNGPSTTHTFSVQGCCTPFTGIWAVRCANGDVGSRRIRIGLALGRQLVDEHGAHDECRLERHMGRSLEHDMGSRCSRRHGPTLGERDVSNFRREHRRSHPRRDMVDIRERHSVAVGDQGTVLHYNGSCSVVNLNNMKKGLLDGVWASASNDVWDCGGVRWNDPALEWKGLVTGDDGSDVTTPDLNAVWRYGGERDVWAIGVGTIIHWNGTAWAQASRRLDGNGISTRNLGLVCYGRMGCRNARRVDPLEWFAMDCGADRYVQRSPSGVG